MAIETKRPTFEELAEKPSFENLVEPNFPVQDTPLDPGEIRGQVDDALDIATRYEIPIESAQQSRETISKLEEKLKGIPVSLGALWDTGEDKRTMRERLGYGKPRDVTMIDIGRTAWEIPKGVARFLEVGVGGTSATLMGDWLGQLIYQGGAAVDWMSKLGTKDKDQIYNPYAQAIMSAGKEWSDEGKRARELWAYWAATGWEALDEKLQETDPVSYRIGRLTEGISSSALSVLAMYLSGGATIAPELINKGIQINRGLLALSLISAAGGFEHAQSVEENFLWSTIHGVADGGMEYAMESTFLEGVGKETGKLTAGFKEGAEEFFTGMFQNTRAGILENEKKGMSAYQGAKEAMISSLKQSPWEIVAGFIGGFGITGGSNLVQLYERSKVTPGEKLAKGLEKKVGVSRETAEEAVGMLAEGKTVEEVDKWLSQAKVLGAKVVEKPPVPPVEAITPEKRPTTVPTEGKVYYHGTSKEGLKNILQKGVIPETQDPFLKRPSKGFFISQDIEKALRFGEEVAQITLKPDAKIATPKNLGEQFYTEWPEEGKLFNVADVIKEAKKQGYDVVDLQAFHNLTQEPVSELVILNPKAIKSIEQAKPTIEPTAKPEVTPVEVEAPTQAKDIVKELTTSLKAAKKTLPTFKKEKAKELGTRVAVYEKFVQKKLEEGVTPLAAHRQARGALKGILADRPQFSPPELSDEKWVALEEDIQNNPYEKFGLWQDNALEALDMVRKGIVPPRFQIAMLEQQFGREFVESIPQPFDPWDVFSQALGLPRATLSSGDISGIARQGRLLANAYPKEGAKMITASLTSFASEEKAIELDKKMRQDDDYAYWKDVGLELPGFAEATPEYEKEERFPTGGIAEKIPLVRRSERSFTVGLNTLRFGVAKQLRALTEAESGKQITIKRAKQIAGWVNAASGRAGRVQHNALKQISMLLNKVMFSPRFALSRVTAPARLLALHNPIVLRSAWRSFAAIEGTNIMIALLAAIAGATIELDPRSADFKKVKTGRLRLDLNAGFQQPLRFLQQMISPVTKTEAGKVRDIGRREAISRFARSKQAPWSGLIWDIFEGRNWIGEPLGHISPELTDKLTRAIPFMTEEQAKQIEDVLGKYPTVTGIAKEAYERIVYLALQGITDAALEEGWPTALLATSEIFGVSSQAYERRASTKLQQLQDIAAQEKYDRKWDNLTPRQQRDIWKEQQTEWEDLETRVGQERIAKTPSQEVFPTRQEAAVRKSMQKAMPKDIKDELFRIGLQVSGVSRTLTIEKRKFYLNDVRWEKYQELATEEIKKSLSKLFDRSAYSSWSSSKQREEATDAMSDAKEKARDKLNKQINKGEL